LLRSLFLQGLFFVAAFILLSSLREMSMLDKNTQVEQLLPIKSKQFTTTTGELVSIEAQDKTTVVYFFAPWCQICHASISNLQSIFENNRHVDVIAVALDFTSQKAVYDFISEHQLTFPVVFGNEQLKQQYAITAYPSYYVLDMDNKIIARSLGYSTELGLYLRTLLL